MTGQEVYEVDAKSRRSKETWESLEPHQQAGYNAIAFHAADEGLSLEQAVEKLNGITVSNRLRC